MHPKTLVPTLALALACFAAPLQAAITVVLSDNNPIFQDVLAGIKESSPDAQSIVMDASGKADIGSASIVVTVGDAAAMLALPSSVKRVAAMVSDFHTKPLGKPINVEMLPDVFNLISLIGDLLPKLQTLAIFSAGDHYESYLTYLESGAKVANDKLKIFRLKSSSDLVSALKSLPGHAEALWVAPDILFVSPANFKLISDFCLASKIALIAPSPLLASAGALAGMAPNLKEIGRAAGTAAKKLELGKVVGMSVDPDNSDTVVNPGTAAALGLSVPAKLLKSN